MLYSQSFLILAERVPDKGPSATTELILIIIIIIIVVVVVVIIISDFDFL